MLGQFKCYYPRADARRVTFLYGFPNCLTVLGRSLPNASTIFDEFFRLLMTQKQPRALLQCIRQQTTHTGHSQDCLLGFLAATDAQQCCPSRLAGASELGERPCGSGEWRCCGCRCCSCRHDAGGGAPVIKVFVEGSSPAVRATLPHQLDGYAIIMERSGRLMPSKDRAGKK